MLNKNTKEYGGMTCGWEKMWRIFERVCAAMRLHEKWSGEALVPAKIMLYC